MVRTVKSLNHSIEIKFKTNERVKTAKELCGEHKLKCLLLLHFQRFMLVLLVSLFYIFISLFLEKRNSRVLSGFDDIVELHQQIFLFLFYSIKSIISTFSYHFRSFPTKTIFISHFRQYNSDCTIASSIESTIILESVVKFSH